jgi:hypothetical protein
VLEGPTSVRVWLRSWSEIIEECKDRLHYFREHLEHDPNIEQALEYFNAAHAAGVIPEPLRTSSEAAAREAIWAGQGSPALMRRRGDGLAHRCDVADRDHAAGDAGEAGGDG